MLEKLIKIAKVSPAKSPARRIDREVLKEIKVE
jgi:hypothetical protein